MILVGTGLATKNGNGSRFSGAALRERKSAIVSPDCVPILHPLIQSAPVYIVGKVGV